MARFTLTNRSDDFDSRDEPDWADGSRVLGGNGHDTIRIEGDRNLIAGGNGDDVLVACGDRIRRDHIGNGRFEVDADGADLDVWSQALMVQSSPRHGGTRYGPGSSQLRPHDRGGPSRDPA